jgi:histidinol phosphatase-like enzyme (inositol monophosphatase family)
MDPSRSEEFSQFLLELAGLAGQVVLPYFRHEMVVGDKGGLRYDPVTEADRGAERALRDAILARYPDHGVLGEEDGDTPGAGPYRWVIDPIDGTRAFVCGVPTWGTLIALCEHGRPVLGMMSQPFVGEVFVGGGTEAWHLRGGERRRLRTRATTELAASFLFATAPEMFAPDTEWPAFQRLSRRVRLARYGIDCYAYCLLAAGHLDLVVEAGLGYYDIAPMIPLIEAAGGIVTDWNGAPVRGGGRVIAAANATLHALALSELQSGGHER